MALPFLPYNFPEEVDKITKLIPFLQKDNIHNILIVTDNNLKSSPSLLELYKILEENHIKYETYSEVEPNPSVSNVEAAKELYIKSGAEAIIAFGGGSPLDCAKAVGARIARPNKDINKMEGILKVFKKTPLLIAIPTTAGTGSEVTLTSVITDKKNKHKYTINDFMLIPDIAVLDPIVTETLSPHLTATTGMDALTHAIEAYIGRSTTKETRKESLEATKLIFENIEKAYKNGDDLEARYNMLKAANLAGKAFSQSYVGYVHAIAHSLGGQYNMAHGYTNAILLPVLLEEYGKIAYPKLYEIANYIGLTTKDDDIKTGALKLIERIKELNKSLEIPERIKEIRLEDVPKMAYYADKEANPLYPVPKLMDKKELEKIYLRVKE